MGILWGDWLVIFSCWNRCISVSFAKKELRYIVALLGLGVLAEIIGYILGKLTGNNLPALHLYTILEFNLIALFYFSFWVFL
ncbi:MAG: hypothetical protein R2822_17415 [Spirosomataceae bacterium]